MILLELHRNRTRQKQDPRYEEATIVTFCGASEVQKQRRVYLTPEMMNLSPYDLSRQESIASMPENGLLPCALYDISGHDACVQNKSIDINNDRPELVVNGYQTVLGSIH